MIPDVRSLATSIVDGYLEGRLAAAGNPAGLREATIHLVADAFAGDAETLMRTQLEQLRGPNSNQFPDAYLADQSVADDALQRAAAGLRTALAQAGTLVDPRPFERAAAARLGDDPRLAIRAEIARVPRPTTRPSLLRWSITPAPWSDESHEDEQWPPPGIDAADGIRTLPGGAAAFAVVDDGPRAGWVQVGLVEQHATPPRRYPDRPARDVMIMLGLEATDNEPPDDSVPFAAGPWQLWTLPSQRLEPNVKPEDAGRWLANGDLPAIALTDTNRRQSGLGRPRYLLAPTLSVIAALGLEPTAGVCGFSLSDPSGPGIVARLWRAHLVHDGNYEPLTPSVQGCDLVVRRDLFEALRHLIGEQRLRVGLAVHYDEAPSVGSDED